MIHPGHSNEIKLLKTVKVWPCAKVVKQIIAIKTHSKKLHGEEKII